MNKILAFILSVVLTISGVGASVLGYTEGTPIKATQREYKFDKEKLLIGGYYGRYDELDYAAEAGIDFIIDDGIDKAYLDKAESLNIGVIAVGYQGIGRYYGTMTENDGMNWVNFDYSSLQDHKALWGLDLIDEPDSFAYPHIQTACKALYDQNKKLVPLVNLFPSYANDQQLGEESGLNFLQKIFSLFTDHLTDSTAKYKKYVSDYINKIDTDYISVDYYPYSASLDKNGNTVKITNSGWIRNLDLLAEACRETDRKLLVITQAAGETKDGAEGGPRWCDEKSDINQQMYASLAFGAKAVIHGLFSRDGWWQTDSHMIGSDGRPTETFYAAKEVNLEVKKFADVYGNYKYTSTYMLNPGKVAGASDPFLNCEVASERGGIKSSNGLLVGTFTGENGSKAYVVVNMEELNDNVTADFTFDFELGKNITVYQEGSFKVPNGSSGKITLKPGEGVFITIE